MKEKLTKEERAARSAAFQEKRLQKAQERYNKMVNYTDAKGLANQTLKELHGARAINITLDDMITAAIELIKEVAKASNVDKKIVGLLKKQAATLIKEEVESTSLALYIDDKGKVKDEALYRILCSKKRNEELRTLLKNMKKAQESK